ncbi:MAG: hypothetical protein KDI66_05835 [Xanthomonadales bacterium]|nr:hypothetical protein [Xanthomonadales bacterium]
MNGLEQDRVGLKLMDKPFFHQQLPFLFALLSVFPLRPSRPALTWELSQLDRG